MFLRKALAQSEAKSCVDLCFEGGRAMISGIRVETLVAHQDGQGAEEGCRAYLDHHCVAARVPQWDDRHLSCKPKPVPSLRRSSCFLLGKGDNKTYHPLMGVLESHQYTYINKFKALSENQVC